MIKFRGYRKEMQASRANFFWKYSVKLTICGVLLLQNVLNMETLTVL